MVSSSGFDKFRFQTQQCSQWKSSDKEGCGAFGRWRARFFFFLLQILFGDQNGDKRRLVNHRMLCIFYCVKKNLKNPHNTAKVYTTPLKGASCTYFKSEMVAKRLASAHQCSMPLIPLMDSDHRLGLQPLCPAASVTLQSHRANPPLHLLQVLFMTTWAPKHQRQELPPEALDLKSLCWMRSSRMTTTKLSSPAKGRTLYCIIIYSNY